MLNVGDDLGRYELITHLKKGGMATLFLGRRKDPPDDRIFAIKVVHPHLEDEELRQMFQDEVNLSSRIQHPNVVRVEEVGEDQGRLFLAMEYVHGCSLAHLLQTLVKLRRRLSPELAIYVAMQVLEGLGAAHDTVGENGQPLNVVHRDVSPQNVLLAHTGEVRLIDFGIAKSRERIRQTVEGSQIRGKLRYMSPEQARGQHVDRMSDIYSLGIVLWETLTMRPLFWAGSTADLLTMVQNPVVEPPSTHADTVSPALDAAVMRALAANPAERPATARAFRDMLSNAVPFAEALEEEQVADLLAAVLGEGINAFAMRLPSMILRRLESGGRESVHDRRLRAEGSGIVEALTNVNFTLESVQARFESEMPLITDDDTQKTTVPPTPVPDRSRDLEAVSEEPTAMASDDALQQLRAEQVPDPSRDLSTTSEQPTAMASADLLEHARAGSLLETSDSTEMLSTETFDSLRVDNDLPDDATEMLSPEDLAAIRGENRAVIFPEADEPVHGGRQDSLSPGAMDVIRGERIQHEVTDRFSPEFRSELQRDMDIAVIRDELGQRPQATKHDSSFPEPPLSGATSKPPPPPMLGVGMPIGLTLAVVLGVLALIVAAMFL